MLNVLLTGTLAADPQRRQTRTGADYATGLMRVPCEDAEAIFVSLITFNADAVRALLALGKGDALAVAGRAKLKTYQRNGEQLASLDVVAEQVLSVYQADKRRRQARGADAEHEPAEVPL